MPETKRESSVAARIEAIRKEIQEDVDAILRHAAEIAALLKWKELESACEPPPRRARWPLVALLLLSMALASLVFFKRIGSASLDLNAAVSELSFTTSARHDFVFPKLIRTLTVSGASSIDGIKCPGASDSLTELRITITGSPGVGNAITPGHLELSSGTKVHVLHRGRSRRIR
jgi:hypothetical protein